MLWVAQVLGISLVLTLSPLMWGITQTTKARLQGRRGPSVWLMYWVMKKNWHKETTVPEFSSIIFRLAPSMTLAPLLVVLITIPIAGRVPALWPHNMLTVFFLLALERFWTGLAGLDSAGTFGGMGASRATTLGTGIEPALFAALGIFWEVSRHAAIEPLAPALRTNPASLFPWALASVSLALVLLAEWGRLPVDNPDTHLELTMIHEATLLEYDGRFLALSQWAMTLKITVLATLGWVILGPNLSSLWSNLALRLAEVTVTTVALGLIESRFTKLRFFQIPAYLAAAAGIGILAFYLLAGGLTV
ncbi:MAG: formate hydrogenlyase [Sulfobacillus acidophilus]|uniref:Formate hydrogenlyase n=1 Tax=Sulfobacillus acidophilus TaxID=53633 RepID=A0A2T2WIE3_9FIRM|nr:MAG: formate hydrogenlyase [Sulfobacillus acidophilus]